MMLLYYRHIRQESRCWLIWDSNTLLWHTGQFTVRAVELRRELPTPDAPVEGTSAPVLSSLWSLETEEEEVEDEEEGEWLTRWKKSKMCVEFRSSRHLFLPPAALWGLLEMDPRTKDPDFSGLPDSLELVLGMLGEADVPVPELLELRTVFSALIWDAEPEPELTAAEPLLLPKCLEEKPGTPFSGLIWPGIPVPVLLVLLKYLENGDPAEPEVFEELFLAGLVLAGFRFKALSNAGVSDARFSSDGFVFLGDFRLAFWKRSCTVVCFGLIKLPLFLVILTGEPLMLTKALWLLTDLLGRAVELLKGDLRSVGEVRAGCCWGFSEWAGLWMGGFCVDADGRVLPPRTIPLPLNGMTFLMSWDPEPESTVRERPKKATLDKIALCSS